MIDHVLGRPSVKSRRLQVLAVLAFWSAYLVRGPRHGPPLFRLLSRALSRRLTAWQTVAVAMLYVYAARNFSTLVGLASPDPLSNLYDATYFRATWVLTALDAGFWTAMRIRTKWLRDLASMLFSLFYLVAAEKADDKVRKVRGNLTVDHLRVSWNKGAHSPYLRFLQGLLRPRLTRWPPRALRIPRPASSDYKEPVSAWLYFDGPLADLEHHSKLVLDLPGGGFVAMDPRCNDDKLFAWAAKTRLPVLSLDYKKAPEYPYPYALNECYDVYTTIIRSRGRCLGLSGREVPRVVVTGDSAGGTLATAMTLMLVESGPGPAHRFFQEPQADDIPLPDGLILFYPGLDMNIGNWMSDEQMSLIKDRRTRRRNKDIIRRKSMQYNSLVGTPHQSDDDDEPAPPKIITARAKAGVVTAEPGPLSPDESRAPQPEYAHSGPTTWTKTEAAAAAITATATASSSSKQQTAQQQQQQEQPPSSSSTTPGRRTTSHHPQPLRTRLAMSSMISYFNDRVLTPEMMRAMIILYVGPHNRPDFSQDYLLSPILAPDALLARFPKTYFLTGERDPLVDDTVIFSARLRRVKAALAASRGARSDYRDGDENDDDDDNHQSQSQQFDERDAAEVVLIPRISHGFLQFPAIYPPAWRHFDRSARWIQEAFAAAEARDRQRKRGFLGVPAGTTGKPPATTSSTPASSTSTSAAAAPSPSGRHHLRQESSGDEDRPLEMSMTRGKARGATRVEDRSKASNNSNGSSHAAKGGLLRIPGQEDGAEQSPNHDQVHGADEEADEEEEEEEEEKQAGQAEGKKRRLNGRARHKDKSLVKLNSSDDLLGRRMQGLAGGLTGLGEDG